MHIKKQGPYTRVRRIEHRDERLNQENNYERVKRHEKLSIHF